MHERGEITKSAVAASPSFWYGLTGTAYVLIAIYLFSISPQTGMSPLKNLVVAALLTIFLAINFSFLLNLVRFIIRVTKIRNH